MCNVVIQDGDTTLIKASKYGHLSIVEYLVQQGADIHVFNQVRNRDCFITILRSSSNLYMIVYIQNNETALSLAKTEEIRKILNDNSKCSIPIIPIVCICNYRLMLLYIYVFHMIFDFINDVLIILVENTTVEQGGSTVVYARVSLQHFSTICILYTVLTFN